MTNASIYAAFERMWEHIVIKLNNFVKNETLNDHIEDKSNPHEITAEQVGAVPITGGIMQNKLTVKGIVLTEGIDYGDSNPTGGVVGQLYFKKVM